MATVKAKWRPSTVQHSVGTIFYQVIHRRKVKQITTSYRLPDGVWDEEKQTIVCDDEHYTMLRLRIEDDLANFREAIRQLEADCRPYTVSDVVRMYQSPRSRVTILGYMRAQIDRLQRANRYGTARNYTKTLNSLIAFLGDADLSLASFNEQLVADYNIFLIRRGLVRNSISFYMRILRAVHNRAVKQRLIEQQNPFEGVYTGIDRTAKRAVKEEVIAQLNGLSLPEESSLAFARDLFLFSYSARGMSFVDIAYLRRSDVQEGVIRYARRKTGQLMTIRIERCMQRIMDRYRREGSPYVFPLLDTTDPAEAYAQYNVAINEYNRQLRRLSQLLPERNKLTSYTARHSWATAARDHQVPMAVISAGMGHSSEQTTRIYLASLENSIIDEANHHLMHWLE